MHVGAWMHAGHESKLPRACARALPLELRLELILLLLEIQARETLELEVEVGALLLVIIVHLLRVEDEGARVAEVRVDARRVVDDSK